MSEPETNNENPEIYHLKKNPDLEKSGLIEYGTFNRITDIMNVYVNHKANAPITWTLERKKWTKNLHMLWEQMQEYGITDNDSKLLCRRFLNANQEEILKSYDKDGGDGEEDEEGGAVLETGGGKITNQQIAAMLIRLAEDHATLFKNEFEEPHALLEINNRHEVLLLDGNKFEKYLAKLFYDEIGIPATAEGLNSAIRTLSAKAYFDGETIPLHLRVAWTNSQVRDSLYYDLSDKNRRYVKITKGKEWEIVEDQVEILFKRFGHTAAQVEPLYGSDSSSFDTFINSLNIKNKKHKLLVKVWIICLLIPDIAHPILLPYGEKGSAKSTLLRKIKTLIDPSSLDLFSIHGRKEEFIQLLSHNYVCFFDNVRYEPRWLSDESCRAVTGGSFNKRKLYTDDEDIPYKYKKILGFSGINVIFTSEDALDRSIKTELKRIKKTENIPDTKIDAQLLQQIPGILGYIFDILALTLQIKDSIQLDELPRMADFAEWGESISRALGHEPLEFLNAYFENIEEQNIEIVEANPFAEAISKFQDYNVVSWISSPKTFIENLIKFADINNIDSTKFSKNPAAVSRRLNRIRSNLREGLGIEVMIDRISSGDGNATLKNTTIIRIRKIPPLAPLAPLSENYDGSTQENSGGSGSSGAIMQKETDEPLIKNSHFFSVTDKIEESIRRYEDDKTETVKGIRFGEDGTINILPHSEKSTEEEAPKDDDNK